MRDPLCRSYPPIPETRKEIEEIFGRIETRTKDDGSLTITNDFRKNIVRVELPIVGHRWVHTLLSEVFMDILMDIALWGHAYEIKTFGTYNVRYIRGKNKKLLSLHSWGIAFDVNARENRMGNPGKIKAESILVESFEYYGFTWGGHWKGKSCDPMHFEYFHRKKK